ncbi:hypothetical protein TRFO_34047 [Tritrichomonas foetus]|uniref:Uncharacterized protein n=1 Tax=Tritrichomonas foetus TaxID=1144522 RepID=A0A1J4JK33_9EUKA|nr:hypothetical protein TRFO_34047 [Tritrichomonas foetus]|eukprot:OHS99506.1 hypothetical protein TRFO_34047 [Tritrichomonas foetus]
MLYQPRTSEEARYLFTKAVNSDDFEAAEIAYQHMLDLQLVEDEMRLGKRVGRYLEQKQGLTEQHESNCDNYDQIVQQKIQAVQKEFMRQYQELKVRQEKELNEAFDKWRVRKDDVEAQSIRDYTESLSTARLMASQARFAEAKNIRDSAFNAKNEYCFNKFKDLTTRYKSLIKSITERHEFEMDSLIKKRDLKMKQLEIEMNDAHENALDCFTVDNASKVAEAAGKPKRKMPLSFAYQTRNNTPCKWESKVTMKTDKSFRAKMNTYNNVFAASDVMNPKKTTKTPMKKVQNTRRLEELAIKKAKTP